MLVGEMIEFPTDQVDLFWTNFWLYWAWTAARILIDPFLPGRWFTANLPAYRQRDWEENGRFYQRLGIDRWKDLLPTFVGPKGFAKKRLVRTDGEYLDRFITETCRAENHHLRAIGSVVVMKLWTPLPLWLFLMFLVMLGNLPFVGIQRYNRPRLQRMLVLQQRRALRQGRRVRPSPHLARPQESEDLETPGFQLA